MKCHAASRRVRRELAAPEGRRRATKEADSLVFAWNTLPGIGFEQRPAGEDIEPYSPRMSPTPMSPTRPSLALITGDFKVRLAGSRKLEGCPGADAFPEVALNASAPAGVSSDCDLHVVVPIMGIDHRPGTSIISHAASRVDHVGGASGRR